MARLKGISANLNAFLDTIAYAEGVVAGKHPLTKDDGYDVIVTGIDGPEIMKSYVDHPFRNRPAKTITRLGLESTASGRYQILFRYWDHYKKLLGLYDFGPISQDKYAIQNLKESGALKHIEAGDFESAVKACRHLWASLPGAGYGQHEYGYSELLNYYLIKGGKLCQPSAQLSSQSAPSLAPSLPETSKVEPKPMQTQKQSGLQSMLTGLLNLIKPLLKRN